LLQAQNIVHDWHVSYAEELDRCQDGKDAHFISFTQLDLRMFQRQYEASRDLIQKEKFWKEAREVARIAIIDLQDRDQKSVFPHYEYNDNLRACEDQACDDSLNCNRTTTSWM
jgi:hypothetical protein